MSDLNIKAMMNFSGVHLIDCIRNAKTDEDVKDALTVVAVKLAKRLTIVPGSAPIFWEESLIDDVQELKKMAHSENMLSHRRSVAVVLEFMHTIYDAVVEQDNVKYATACWDKVKDVGDIEEFIPHLLKKCRMTKEEIWKYFGGDKITVHKKLFGTLLIKTLIIGHIIKESDTGGYHHLAPGAVQIQYHILNKDLQKK